MRRVIIAAIAASVLVAGCSGGAPATAPTTTAPTTTAPAASLPGATQSAPATTANEDPSGGMTKFSKRGAKIETVGGRQDAVEASRGYALDFTVDAITVDPPCVDKYSSQVHERPVNGHLMAVAISLETRPEYDRSQLSIDPFAEQNWHYVSPDDQVTQTLYGSASSSCKVPELASDLLPSSKYKGTVMLDVPATSGVLLLDANGGATNGTGNRFEWTLPPPGAITSSATTPAPTTTAAPTTAKYVPPTTTRAPVPKAATSTAGCAARAMAVGRFDPSCPEYQGYLDPGGAGRGPTSGEIQSQYARQQCAAGVKSFC
jgi:hypothetical protein